MHNIRIYICTWIYPCIYVVNMYTRKHPYAKTFELVAITRAVLKTTSHHASGLKQQLRTGTGTPSQLRLFLEPRWLSVLPLGCAIGCFDAAGL